MGKVQGKGSSSITIMVPAYNEEENLEKAVRKYDRIAKRFFDKNYEILIFDDYSTDRTGKIADALARENQRIKVIHNKPNKGLGYNYREGVRLARYKYYIGLSGEGDANQKSIISIFKRL